MTNQLKFFFTTTIYTLHSLLEDEFPKNDFENFLIHDKPLTDPNIVQTSQLSFGKNYGQS